MMQEEVIKPVYAVIVAGGKGVRMDASIRKQYLILDDKPILAHTLLALSEISAIEKFFLSVPKTDFDFCRAEILPLLASRVPVELVPGGGDRQASVFNGLSAITEKEGVALIHDGVRPFVPLAPTRKAISLAGGEKGCILGIPAVDTLKCVDGNGCITETVPRQKIWQAQTPQVFGLDFIRRVHAQAASAGFCGTDDASLAEQAGGTVCMIYGSKLNIKITTPDDLIMAGGILYCLRGKQSL
jgi:2-C-methyl-D-erythritol 4-phosphate cytidylyltransferase